MLCYIFEKKKKQKKQTKTEAKDLPPKILISLDVDGTWGLRLKN